MATVVRGGPDRDAIKDLSLNPKDPERLLVMQVLHGLTEISSVLSPSLRSFEARSPVA